MTWLLVAPIYALARIGAIISDRRYRDAHAQAAEIQARADASEQYRRMHYGL